jgi:ubiquinone/menaquinone biosynthesis C-methylase UbiE
MNQGQLKKSVKEYWDNEPCGTGGVKFPEGSLDYFEEIERYRYSVEPFIHSFAQFTRWRGKRMLEIGCGAGTDMLQFARAGAEVHAIDLSTHSVALAKKRLSVYGLKGEVQEADAEHLPFPDNYFDLVYSWGVLHHTPDTEGAIKEVYRVLKPDGQIRIMLYNRHSWIALKMYLKRGLLGGKPFMSLSKIISNYEESKGTKAYTAKEIQKLFSAFSNVKVQFILTYYDYLKSKGFFPPTWIVRLMGDKFGWFIEVSGEKAI